MKENLKKIFLIPFIIAILNNAFWDKILSPCCTYLYIHLSLLIDKFTITFSNNTYKKISAGYNISTANDYLFYTINMAVIALYLYEMYKNIKIIVSDKDSNHSLSKILTEKNLINFIIIIGIQLPMMVSMYLLGNRTYINNCRTASLCNLEIVSSYISDAEYKELKSTFYSIQTKGDYEEFKSKIYGIGEMYSVELRK